MNIPHTWKYNIFFSGWNALSPLACEIWYWFLFSITSSHPEAERYVWQMPKASDWCRVERSVWWSLSVPGVPGGDSWAPFGSAFPRTMSDTYIRLYIYIYTCISFMIILQNHCTRMAKFGYITANPCKSCIFGKVSQIFHTFITSCQSYSHMPIGVLVPLLISHGFLD